MDYNRQRRMRESNPRLPYPTLSRQPTNPTEFVFDIGKLLLLPVLTRALVQTCFLVLFCATLGSRVYVLPHTCA